ncbi:MAG: MATE family efflux transporter [Myxococcales bacterium]
MRSELGRLVGLSVPVAMTQVGIMLTGVVDTLMVARVNVDALAATAVANMWQWGFLAIGMGLVMGMDPLVSQAHGRGDGRACGLALHRGLLLALLVSVPICIAQALTGPAMQLLRQPQQVAELAQRYNLLKLPTVPCFLAYSALRQYLQGRTLMAPATWVMWISNGFNVLFNWALIFGHLGLPAMGLSGAAIASSLTCLIMLLGLAAWTRAFRLHEGAWVPASREAFSLSGLVEMTRYGLPVGLQMSLEGWAFSACTFMAGWISVQAVGAHHVVLNMAALAFMLPMGLSMGAATRVGNLIGAGDEAGMRRAAWLSIWLGGGVMLASSTAFVVLRAELPHLYTDDPGVVALASQILPLAGAFGVADGIQAVAGGVLRGMGRPNASAVAHLVLYYPFALPLAYVLAFRYGGGLQALWLSLALGLISVALTLMWWVRLTARRPLAELQVSVQD